jgi:hypothetical protein
MIDWNKPLQTVDGRAVRLIGVLAKSGTETHVCAVMHEGTGEVAYVYPLSGIYYCDVTSRHDLENFRVDWTKPLRTRNYEPAVLVTTLKNDPAPYVIVVTRKDGSEFVATMTKTGFDLSGDVDPYILNT